MRKINILNIEIDNLFLTEALEKITSGLVFTPNVDHIMKLQKDPDFLKLYNSADYKLCDSQIVIYASNFLGTPIKQKISGSDFFPAFYTYHKNNKNIKIFLLGGPPGVSTKAKENINKKVKREIVVGDYSPSFGFENNPQECAEIVEMINKSGATVLAVGVGSPKQENWIYAHKDKLPNVKIFLAIGATINFEAGDLKRAPKFLSKIGLEWLHRLFSEPQRLWKRYLVEDLPFIYLIVKQKIRFNINSRQRIKQLNQKSEVRSKHQLVRESKHCLVQD
ncbi:WecB/TagA/CpsF family glycosyltransferase [Aetokthonos hydrillicola Thurmond2011]|jgi:exopolysaccharide biosynthesis WecB/TagA/CpsF family protein|uniref:WecB/TagA/CpsF family glycosyltransferase n=1 Tax=Aetokthonos hydrillicola Thurmond2011 TaxID=2712845 RepID=A0AAP5M2X8_9CYAN|nr:WecB/TagA/CpsF family glycosyltransferase [Aetokthonos hydrillicola]MBO3463736.1 WecB/TagA/CpsF family glycosyltransferase [Aetokthonos hydrillicola CCALA 1050]MBW4589594.1 WecB/TagA/CpsF family glycosyltransferase [Aetokthonos hydrillicola CCALA 1050]MDR9893196.1 WecB/TagA/CpsF family glycosyltransferase [Aetokthonos hydrillicola Thurmond2011]